jgi:hypothetical protein
MRAEHEAAPDIAPRLPPVDLLSRLPHLAKPRNGILSSRATETGQGCGWGTCGPLGSGNVPEEEEFRWPAIWWKKRWSGLVISVSLLGLLAGLQRCGQLVARNGTSSFSRF